MDRKKDVELEYEDQDCDTMSTLSDTVLAMELHAPQYCETSCVLRISN